MASCLKITTAVQSLESEPVCWLLMRKTRGHAIGIIPSGTVASKTIRCLPLIFLNHSSGSSAGVKICFECAASFAGKDRDAIVKAPAPIASVPRKLRRLVDVLLSCTFIIVILKGEKLG